MTEHEFRILLTIYMLLNALIISQYTSIKREVLNTIFSITEVTKIKNTVFSVNK